MDNNDKSANGGAKKRKLSTNTGPELSKWCLPKEHSDGIAPSDISKPNAKIEPGKGKKRKLLNVENGSEKASKRRLDNGHMDHTKKTMTKENGELSNLPGELLTIIIKMVPIPQWASLESVSRNFREIVHGLWGQQREIRLDELVYNKEQKPHEVVEGVLNKILIRAPNVASIIGFADLFDHSTSIPLETIQLLSKFEHLETIDFSGGRVVTARNFASFLESSASRKSWKRLDIVGGVFENVQPKGPFGIKEDRSILINLECFKFSVATIYFFHHFLRIQWSGLKKLVLSESRAHAKAVLIIIRQCTQLTHLEIKIPQCLNANGQPSYGTFMQGVVDLENLNVLKISGGSLGDNYFHDALLVRIEVLGHRPITDFSLVDCYCSNQMVREIIDHLPRLKSLEISVTFCTTPSLQRLVEKMGQLETLKLRSCLGVVDRDLVRAICGKMTNLQCLHLDYLNNIESEDFTCLGDLRKLKELRIMERSMETRTIETLVRLGFGSCVEKLVLVAPCGISPEMMGAFFKNMPRLSCLKLEGATNGILEAIAVSCPKLLKLDVGSSFIASIGIQSIINSCPRLKLVNVSNEYGWFPRVLRVGKYRKITFVSLGRAVITRR